MRPLYVWFVFYIDCGSRYMKRKQCNDNYKVRLYEENVWYDVMFIREALLVHNQLHRAFGEHKPANLFLALGGREGGVWGGWWLWRDDWALHYTQLLFNLWNGNYWLSRKNDAGGAQQMPCPTCTLLVKCAILCL